jgi:hypothetical protein
LYFLAVLTEYASSAEALLSLEKRISASKLKPLNGLWLAQFLRIVLKDSKAAVENVNTKFPLYIFIDDHFPLIISEMKVHGNFSDLNNILKDSLMNSLKKLKPLNGL